MTVDTDSGIGGRIGLELMLGQLKTTMGGVTDALDKIHKFLAPNPRQSPIVRPLQGAVVSDGSTYIYIDMGAPSAGRVWDIRRLATWKGGGVDPFAAVSGVNVIAVVMTQAVPNKGTSSIAGQILDVLLAPGQVPNDAVWSAHEATIRFQQRLVMIYKGTSNNDNYIATGQAEEYLESSFEFVVA